MTNHNIHPCNASTAYYHFGTTNLQSCQFALKVRLRRIPNDHCSNHHGNDDERHDEIQECIEWQQKIMGPPDILGSCATFESNEKSSQRWTAGRSIDPTTRIGELSSNKNSTILSSCLQKSQNGMMIYTYVDKDLATPQMIPFVSDEVTKGTFSTHLSNGIDMLPSHCLNSDDTLPRKTAGRVHERLSREDPQQFMFIVAAVDINVEERQEVVTEDNRNKNKPQYFEQVLCVLRLHQNGTLEASPKLSTREPDIGDCNNFFVSDETLDAWNRDGYSITTYSFYSSSGTLFQYCIERLDWVEDWNDLEELIEREIDDDYKNLLSRQTQLLERCYPKNNNASKSIESSESQNERVILLNILSAENFPSVYPCLLDWSTPSLYIKYDLISETIDEFGNSLTCILSNRTQNSKAMRTVGTSNPGVFSAGWIILAIILYLELILFLKIDWRVPLAAIVLLIILHDTSFMSSFRSIRDVSDSHPPHNCFGQLDEVHVPRRDAIISSRFYLMIQAITTVDGGNSNVIGVGCFQLPTKPGHHEMIATTYNIIGLQNERETYERMCHYYFGRPPLSLESMASLFLTPRVSPESVQGNNKHVGINHYGKLSETAGSVKIRVEILPDVPNRWSHSKDL